MRRRIHENMVIGFTSDMLDSSNEDLREPCASK